MAYKRQNFIDGAVLTANNLNLMEDGIISKQDASNLITTLDENSDHTHYPSAKAVYTFVDEYLGEINATLNTIVNGEESVSE